MKLKLSDIYSGFHEKYLTIPIDTLPKRGTIFIDSDVQCTISTNIVEDGYEIKGNINTNIEIDCVRCLESKSLSITLPLKIILYDSNINNSSNNDTIYIKSNMEFIDFNCIVADLIELSKPMNPLCHKNCCGLCYICGINKNYSKCTCKIEKVNLVSDKFKIT
mgnify:FL=1